MGSGATSTPTQVERCSAYSSQRVLLRLSSLHVVPKEAPQIAPGALVAGSQADALYGKAGFGRPQRRQAGHAGARFDGEEALQEKEQS